jgi:hypothetical protein
MKGRKRRRWMAMRHEIPFVVGVEEGAEEGAVGTIRNPIGRMGHD